MQTANVYGAQRRIADVSVLLRKLDQTWSEYLDLLLARPNGDNFLFLSDIGCSDDSVGGYLFTDSGTVLTSEDDFYLAPAGGIIPQGNLPTDVDSEFGATIGPLNHADANLPHTFASTFGGGIPGGNWALFALDEAPNDLTNLEAWALNIEANEDVGRIVGLASCVNTITVSSDNSTEASWDFNGQCGGFCRGHRLFAGR